MVGSIAAQTGIIRGTIKSSGAISGSMRVPIGVVPIDDYAGPYEVTPAVDAQTMDTMGKRMTDDVLVHAIPYHEVSNTDGLTVIIGG